MFSGLVTKKYDSEFAAEGAKKGQQIFIRKPAQYRVRSGATMEIQDIIEDQVAVTLPAQIGVDFSFSSRELTIDIDNNTRLYSERFIVPAGSALASNKDAEGLQIAALNSGYTIVTPATPTLKNFLDAKSILNKFLAPKGQNDRLAVIGSDVESAIANEVKVLFNSSAEIDKAIKAGEVTSMAGLTFGTSDLTYVRTNGGGGGVVTVGAAYTAGDSTITIAGAGAAAVAVGDTLQFTVNFVNPETKQLYANKLQRKVLGKAGLVCTIDPIYPADGATNTPALRAAYARANASAVPANGSTVTVLGVAGTQYLCSVVFHKEAIVLTSVDLIMPEKGVEMSDRITVDGMAIRFIRSYDTSGDTLPNRFDTLSVYTPVMKSWIISVETPLN